MAWFSTRTVAVADTKQCKCCGEVKPLTRETWVWRKRDGFCGRVCLACDRLKSKLNAQEIRSTPEGMQRFKEASARYLAKEGNRAKSMQATLRAYHARRATPEGAEILRARSTAANAKYRATEVGKEKANAANRAWKQANYAKVLAATRLRQTGKAQRSPKWLCEDDQFIFEEAYNLAALRQKLTGIAWHVDHIIPLHGALVSGLHVPENIQVIPAVVNMRKNNKWPT